MYLFKADLRSFFSIIFDSKRENLREYVTLKQHHLNFIIYIIFHGR